MRYVGATIYKPGRVCDIVGIEIEPGRGAVAVGECELPMGVGARGGKLARIGRKLARSKALKRIASTAVKTAGKLGGGAQRDSVLKLASVAARSASKLERSAIRDSAELRAEDADADDFDDVDDFDDFDDFDPSVEGEVGLSADWASDL